MTPQRALDQYEREMENDIYHFAYFRCSIPGLEDLQAKAQYLLECFRKGNVPLPKAEEWLWDLEIIRIEAINQ